MNNSVNLRKDAIRVLGDYVKARGNYNIIHYARQNCFDEFYEKGPRIIAIAIMNADSEQMMVFSLKKSADKLNLDFFGSTNGVKDEIELNMLKSFFEYVDHERGKKWFHWNMKNNNFGFADLEERYKTLSGTEFHFEEERLINISALLKNKYGTGFAMDNTWNGQIAGKMYDVFQLNGINDFNILNGQQEIKEYILQNVVCIEQSVIAKLKAFRVIIEKATDNALKTRGHVFKDVYGFGIRGLAQYICDNATLSLCFAILGSIIAAVICKLIGI